MSHDDENLLPPEPAMDREEWAEHRLALANRLEDVARAMYRMQDYWDRFDLPGDFLDADKGEFPFEHALEDMQCEVEGAVEIIRENTDTATTDTQA